MKKRAIALTIIGIMIVNSCILALASRNSASKYGNTSEFRATGTITVDNVSNTAIATVTTNVDCGMQATAIFRYSNGQISSGPMSSHGKSCTNSIQKSYVQAVGATGIFSVTRNGSSWSDVVDVGVK